MRRRSPTSSASRRPRPTPGGWRRPPATRTGATPRRWSRGTRSSSRRRRRGTTCSSRSQPGRGVALANVHLPSDDPGPQAIRRGAPGREGRRDRGEGPPAVHPDGARGAAAAGGAGHPGRSWSATSTRRPGATTPQEVVGTRDYVKYVVEWPVSKAVEAAGFATRGARCTPTRSRASASRGGRRGPRSTGGTRGPTRRRTASTSSTRPARRGRRPRELAGEKGGPEVTFAVKPWPSDHRAVMSTFAVTPGALPVDGRLRRTQWSTVGRTSRCTTAAGRPGD